MVLRAVLSMQRHQAQHCIQQDVDKKI
jgi:hypothetical protein